jgi:acyl CoA:acetate/3-ketoacid CoA transferase
MKAIGENKMKCWMFPLGTMLQVFKEMARRGPGIYSKTGLGTIVDPVSLAEK